MSTARTLEFHVISAAAAAAVADAADAAAAAVPASLGKRRFTYKSDGTNADTSSRGMVGPQRGDTIDGIHNATGKPKRE